MKRFLITFVVALALAPAAALAGDPPSPAAKNNAAQMCTDLRLRMGLATFKQSFGTNMPSRSNAFGKCVSKFAPTEQQSLNEASEQCRAEQADPTFAVTHGGKTFSQFYGTNAGLSNAFGKCVSSKAKAQSDDQVQAQVNAARLCKAERAANPTAFKNKWGTNRNKSNAFGKCVSAKAKAQQNP